MNPNLAFSARISKHALNAIICIAACAMFQSAVAQNAVQTPAASAAENNQTNAQARDAGERAERERINQERQRVSAQHAAAKELCYQKFRVNDCLSEARNTHNNQLADLKRQEISLNDLQRKRRGAEQVRKVEEKTSPERQEEIAQQRGKALAADAKRQQRQSERAVPVAKATREPKPKPEAKAARGPKSVGNAPQARSSNAAEKLARQKSKAVDRQERIAAAARAKVQNEQRSKDAAAHAASVQNRQKQHKKPPAAALPIPPN
jgi:colicin import membrane protein